LALALEAFVGLYFAVVGWPRTPMTEARANRLFGEGLRPGQNWGEVKAWLASRGIRYEVLKRVEGDRYEGAL
jgi:hypothetical protein